MQRQIGEDLGVDIDGGDRCPKGAGAENARQPPAAAGVEDAQALGQGMPGEKVGQ
ncbi:MAG: hypothetical protein QGH25_24170 [Candidatus Latescibacteria bacterium]|nr:hypothetical protein [Candidatus Latescibacterota bacterium]